MGREDATCGYLFLEESCALNFSGKCPVDFKGEVQSRITIISKERVKIPPQIGAKIMKIG